ncbi:MAG TPA: hypothetical protein VF808_00045 [Ktedonobacterales bacterium]
MIETKRVVRILTDLEGINEDLLNLYEDIQRNIDPHDRVARAEGPRRLAEYAEQLDAFESVSTELRALIERITGVDMRREVENTTPRTDEANRQALAQLQHMQPHSLTEDFTSTRPFGLVLIGRAYADARTWRRVYQFVCQLLAKRDPDRYNRLPDVSPFRDNLTSRFERGPQGFHVPLPLALDLYCEANVSAKGITGNIRRLLAYFSIPESEMVVYLREDRDAE